jgi:hypothetical protein
MPMPRLPETHHKKHGDEKRLPGEEEKCRDGAHVKQPMKMAVTQLISFRRLVVFPGFPVAFPTVNASPRLTVILVGKHGH